MKTECIDKKFEKMLYAFELDILPETDRRALEIHLIECDSCFAKALELEKAAMLITQDPEVRRTITSEPVPIRPNIETEKAVPATTSIVRKLVPAIAALLVLTALVFKPWQIEISPTDEALAAPNRLAVMYFDNLADSSDSTQLGAIITNLLIADLSESHYVQVVSSQRLYDIIKLLGYDQSDVVDMQTATEVARKAEARWMLVGHILSDSPNLVLSSQILDVNTGDVLVSQQVSSVDDEDVFALVDRFSAEVKNELAIPQEALTEPDRAVADFTTHSKDAYRHYLDGLDYLRMMYYPEADESFHRAIDLDSTMAMAYYKLALMGDPTATAKAVQYIDHTSARERYYIRSYEAASLGNYKQAMSYLEEAIERFPDEKDYYQRLGWYEYRLRNFQKSAEYAERSLEIDPLNDVAYNQLAYTYARLGEFDKALKAADKYVELTPNEANPYDTKGDILVMMGDTDAAKRFFRRALEVKADYSSSSLSLSKLFIIENDFLAARDALGPLLSGTEDYLKCQANYHLALMLMKSGQLERAESFLDESLALDAAIRYRDQQVRKRWLKTLVFMETDRPASAYEEFSRLTMSPDTVLSPHPELGFKHYNIQLVAQTDRFEKAERLATNLKQDLTSKRAGRFGFNYGMGCAEFARGNFGKAVSHFEIADTTYQSFPARYMLARSYVASGNYARSIEIFEELLSQRGEQRPAWCILDPKISYYLGYALEMTGDTKTAISHYRLALEIWKDADTPIAEMELSRMRLDELEKTS